MSAVKDYEIDLRGNKITTIENLGATENQFDSIDLSDNMIVRLEGFPKLPRLKTLLLNNNRIVRVGRHLEEATPNIEWLILTNNRLGNLQDLDPLATLPKLSHLSLKDNPVALKADYRLYVIYRCKHLKQLDFKKVKQKEREAAAAKYASGEAAADGTAATFEPDEELQQAEASRQQPVEQEQAPKQPSAEQLLAIKAAVANLNSLEEASRLEASLAQGQMPSEITAQIEQQKAALAQQPQANGTAVAGGDEALAMDQG